MNNNCQDRDREFNERKAATNVFLNIFTPCRLVFQECFTQLFRVCKVMRFGIRFNSRRHAQILKDDVALYTRFLTKQNEFVPNEQTQQQHTARTSAWHSGRIVLDLAPPTTRNCKCSRSTTMQTVVISIVNIIIIIRTVYTAANCDTIMTDCSFADDQVTHFYLFVRFVRVYNNKNDNSNLLSRQCSFLANVDDK